MESNKTEFKNSIRKAYDIVMSSDRNDMFFVKEKCRDKVFMRYKDEFDSEQIVYNRDTIVEYVPAIQELFAVYYDIVNEI